MYQNAYVDLKQRQQEEFNNFPMGFAFTDKQFDEAMQRLGLSPNDTDNVVGIGASGFIRKSDKDAFLAMCKRHKDELKAAIAADENGTGFVSDMFDYELANHEFCVTGDATDALEALGLTLDDVKASPKMRSAMVRAIDANQPA